MQYIQYIHPHLESDVVVIWLVITMRIKQKSMKCFAVDNFRKPNSRQENVRLRVKHNIFLLLKMHTMCNASVVMRFMF